MPHKIIYTADIHGNEVQYRKLIDYAIQVKADSIIIGGDIAPKSFPRENYINKQKEFLKNRLPELLRPLYKTLPNSKIYLMMGNDDCMANRDILEKEDGGLYKLIHKKRVKLTKDYDLVGYSYVPITPFGIKDWEKYDFSNVPRGLGAEYLHRKNTNYRLEAKKSTKVGWENFIFTHDIEKKDSIQRDLEKELFTKNSKKTIYTIHTPPDNTNLDLCPNHVGSMALRIFIEKKQPYLTLHGHIHETVDISGSFKDKIGDTLCLSVGNYDTRNELAVLTFNLNNPEEVVREII